MTAAALAIERLQAGYPGRPVLHEVDLSVARGEWLALVGPNGSGKSTLLDCVSARLAASGGTIRIDGVALEVDATGAKRRLGYAVAPDRLPPLLTPRHCLAVHASAKQVGAEDSEWFDLADRLGLVRWLDDPVGLCSYGTRQKLSVLLALVGAPALVVLDESFNGLDPASSLVLKRHLRARVDAGACAVLLATHALDIVERYADRAVLLNDGRLIGAWSASELRAAGDSSGGLEAVLAQVVESRGESTGGRA